VQGFGLGKHGGGLVRVFTSVEEIMCILFLLSLKNTIVYNGYCENGILHGSKHGLIQGKT
jgi:hypothetical protein